MDDSIDLGNFSVKGHLQLFQKDSATYMHGLAVYMKEGLPFSRDFSLENSADSYLCFELYFTQYFTSFSSIHHFLYLYTQFLMLFHLK